MSQRFMRSGAPILLLGLLAASAAAAQIQNLSALQERRSQLSQTSDSLMSVRVRLMAQRDSMASRADSLWTRAPASGELERTRVAFRLLAGRLRVVEIRLDSLSASGDSLEEGLRDAYDWEISRLHGLLADGGWDEGLYRQLLVFQEERESLGNSIRGSNYRLDAEHELGISDEDGPEELRQKIEYAQDRVGELQSQQRDIARRLRHLDREMLVMRKYWHLNEEILRLRQDIDVQMRMRTPSGAEGGELTVAQHPEVPRRGAAMAPAVDEAAPTTPVEAELLLEVQRLRARQQECGEIEAVLQSRIAVFHERLTRMLDGAE